MTCLMSSWQRWVGVACGGGVEPVLVCHAVAPHVCAIVLQLLDTLKESNPDVPMWLLRDSAECLSSMAERVRVVRVASKSQPSLLSSTRDILKTVCMRALLRSPSLSVFPLLNTPAFVKLRTKLVWCVSVCAGLVQFLCSHNVARILLHYSTLARLVFVQAKEDKGTMLSDYFKGPRLLGHDDGEATASVSSAVFSPHSRAAGWFHAFVADFSTAGDRIAQLLDAASSSGARMAGVGLHTAEQTQLVVCWLRDVSGLIEAATARAVRAVCLPACVVA